MATLYQHEKNLLMGLAEHHQLKANRAESHLGVPGHNDKMFRKQHDKETEIVRVLKKAAK
ncbi:MAG: hypothetical protein GY737_14045 [Desulfobacteraceae bacterium]|nr:hypothetical protein [Desulfobacteraceae bacterium]